MPQKFEAQPDILSLDYSVTKMCYFLIKRIKISFSNNVGMGGIVYRQLII